MNDAVNVDKVVQPEVKGLPGKIAEANTPKEGDKEKAGEAVAS